MKILDISQYLVNITEKFLTYRAKKKYKTEKKQKKRGVVFDWLISFLWAAGVVLLLNQYLLQAYMIPSGSMIPSLIVKDRIFVNKLIFGPELLPGLGKLPSLKKPMRYNVVIFENPDYLSRGTSFEVVQRILFMLSLSMIDINKDSNGNPKVQFLIKRLIGLSGDKIKTENGDTLFKPKGTSKWLSNKEYRKITNASFPNNDPAPNIEQYRDEAERFRLQYHLGNITSYPRYSNTYDMKRLLAINEYKFEPVPLASQDEYSLYQNGWYVAENRYFFMGDNRDNSKDARSYSGVPSQNILGKAIVFYLPFSRIRVIL